MLVSVLLKLMQRRGIDSRLIVFPNENHWVLSPQHAKAWYEVVLGFLDEHVRGIPATPPETLG